jgi:hypothetical protein
VFRSSRRAALWYHWAARRDDLNTEYTRLLGDAQRGRVVAGAHHDGPAPLPLGLTTMEAVRSMQYDVNDAQMNLPVEDVQAAWQANATRRQQQRAVVLGQQAAQPPAQRCVAANITPLALQHNRGREPMPLTVPQARNLVGPGMRVYTNRIHWGRFVGGRLVTEALRNCPCFRTDHPDCRDGFIIGGRGINGISQWVMRSLPDPMRYFATWARQLCNMCEDEATRRLNAIRDTYTAWSILVTAAVQRGHLTFDDFFRPNGLVLWMSESEALLHCCDYI